MRVRVWEVEEDGGWESEETYDALSLGEQRGRFLGSAGGASLQHQRDRRAARDAAGHAARVDMSHLGNVLRVLAEGEQHSREEEIVHAHRGYRRDSSEVVKLWHAENRRPHDGTVGSRISIAL